MSPGVCSIVTSNARSNVHCGVDSTSNVAVLRPHLVGVQITQMG